MIKPGTSDRSENMDTLLFEENLYSQDTEFEILHALLPYIHEKTFIDVGAEKGTFARFLLQHGFRGVLFEPCPRHYDALQELTEHTTSRFFSYAIDGRDRETLFYINCDDNGEPLDYFHSLHYLANDPQVKHQKHILVTCRSLQSLLNEGTIEKDIGILKIDTEGNDLQILKGMGEVCPEVIICEFFTKGLFAGWEQGDPRALITKIEQFGFSHYLAVKRCADRELVSFSPVVFCEKQWGNLIFLNAELYQQAFHPLRLKGNRAYFIGGNDGSIEPPFLQHLSSNLCCPLLMHRVLI